MDFCKFLLPFFKYNQKDILLFGRESAGVPNSIHQCVDERLVIPMQKGLRSLNVSSAVSMIMGEALKQLNYLLLHIEVEVLFFFVLDLNLLVLLS